MDTFQLHDQTYRVWRNQDGYACITRSDRGYPQAVLLHRLVWELAHGPIPPGHEIHHLDGDRFNWRPDNLEALDRRAHRALHRRGPKPAEVALARGDREGRGHPPRREREEGGRCLLRATA